METAIRIEELTRDFENVRAVDQLDLEIPIGTVFGFLGPNGSGKTTTIRLLLGLLEPTSGNAEVLGHDIRTQADAVREKCGALLEHNGLYERLTAYDNLDFYGQVWHLSKADRQSRIQNLLNHLGLWDRKDEQVRDWSRGMKQKLAVARTLLHRPQLVFLDEPTAGLDPVAASALRDDLAGLAAREGTTIFLTTHNLTEAERLCHQVGVLKKGRLMATGTPGELRKRTGGSTLQISGKGFQDNLVSSLEQRKDVDRAVVKNGYLTIYLTQETESAPIIRALVTGGADVEEVHRGQANLEDVFLQLMKEEEEVGDVI